MGIVSVQTNECHREIQFEEGHPGRNCHIGLKEIDLRLCQHCVWLGVKTNSVQKLGTFTGPELMEMLAFVDGMRERHAAKASEGQQ